MSTSHTISLFSICAITALALTVFLLPSVDARAQSLGAADTTTITTVPKVPAASEDVMLTLTSYDGNLEAATISWFRDGKLIERGRGLRRVTVTMPALGKSTTVTAIAELTTGKQISKELVLHANTVTVVTNAGTRTPPFYKGKARPTIGSATLLSVFPELFVNGARVDPDRLIYSWWSDGGNFVGKSSGSGLRNMWLNNPYFNRDIQVVVDVTDPSTGTKGQGMVTIESSAPKALLYENHPLWGIWYNAVLPNTFVLNKAELNVTAEPYFFTREDALKGLEFQWLVPGASAPFRSSGNALVFRPIEGEEGEATVSLTVRSPSREGRIASQQAKVGFSATYGPLYSASTPILNEEGLPVF